MKIIYLVTDPLSPVVYSQVLENVLALSEKGIDVKVIFLLQLRHYLNTAKKTRETLDKLGIKYSIFPVPLQNSFIGRLVAFLFLCWELKNNINKKVIFHCRGLRSSRFALTVKNLISKKCVIYDMRGDYIAEREFSGENKEQLKKTLDLENYCLNKVDHVLFVSRYLQETVSKRYEFMSFSSDIIYCTASEEKTGFSLPDRERIRELHKLTDKLVFVYSGSIGRWHCFDKVIEVCEVLAEQYPQASFLFLTNQKDQASMLIDNSQIKEKSTVLSVAPQEIGAWLSASDVAIIIREPHPLNYGASPVKVAEYMINGLPMIISDAVRDYSSMIERAGIGMVLTHEMLTDKDLMQISIQKRTGEYWENSRNAYEEELIDPLTKKYSLDKVIEIYNGLVKV